MQKKILFFTQNPPLDKDAIHIWMGKTKLSHEMQLRHLLELYLGFPPPKFVTNSKGKLYLPDSPLHFNLSDSKEWLAIAFSWEAPVGIDIETIRPIEEMDQFIIDYFSKEEQAYIKEKDSIVRLFEIWSRKEACFKAMGIGLQDDMDRWNCCGKDWIFVNEVWVKSLPIGNNLAAAVAIYQ
ncbi:MAG: 4'-phosphopantetheinyl transferase superfamily protein [Simkaniaceae bacterium]|nr:4'-phosphopantetheinyl transferase superfamily protein [Simkaniaceae bacterium]